MESHYRGRANVCVTQTMRILPVFVNDLKSAFRADWRKTALSSCRGVNHRSRAGTLGQLFDQTRTHLKDGAVGCGNLRLNGRYRGGLGFRGRIGRRLGLG
ncbi:hypothetical protein D9M73_178470 [compost metagenome]